MDIPYLKTVGNGGELQDGIVFNKGRMYHYLSSTQQKGRARYLRLKFKISSILTKK